MNDLDAVKLMLLDALGEHDDEFDTGCRIVDFDDLAARVDAYYSAQLPTRDELAKLIYETFYPGPMGGAKEHLAQAILDRLVSVRSTVPDAAPTPSKTVFLYGELHDEAGEPVYAIQTDNGTIVVRPFVPMSPAQADDCAQKAIYDGYAAQIVAADAAPTVGMTKEEAYAKANAMLDGLIAANTPLTVIDGGSDE